MRYLYGMGNDKKKLFAISGSTRMNSTNTLLIRAIAELTAGDLDVEVFEGTGQLPHFDPGLVDTGVPQEVLLFRQKLAAADGILICTPEYAHGVPGSLKNAIDWTVASGEFSHKPTALITASTDGRYAHAALLETLRVIEAENIDRQQLLIPFVRTKITGEGRIADVATLEAVKGMMQQLINTMEEQRHVAKSS